MATHFMSPNFKSLFVTKQMGTTMVQRLDNRKALLTLVAFFLLTLAGCHTVFKPFLGSNQLHNLVPGAPYIIQPMTRSFKLFPNFNNYDAYVCDRVEESADIFESEIRF